MVLAMPTKSQRQKALETLPTELYCSFQAITSRIRNCPNVSQAELGIQVLMWLHLAYRPLKLEELQHALAVEKSQIEFKKDNIPSQKMLLNSYFRLVVVDNKTLTVHFVHYTLEEYFREHTREEFPNGYSYIAKTCLTYLSFGELRLHCTSLESLNKKMKEYALLGYASLYWGTYVKQQFNDSLTEYVKVMVDHQWGYPPCAFGPAAHQCTETFRDPCNSILWTN